MLIGKDLKIANSKDKKQYMGIEFDCPYFQHASTDPTEKFQKGVQNGKAIVRALQGDMIPVTAQGLIWEGVAPVNELPAKTDLDSVTVLFEEALNYMTSAYGKDKVYIGVPADSLPYILVLRYLSSGVNLAIRASLNDLVPKEAKAIDPKLALKKEALAKVVSMASNGKIVSLEQAARLIIAAGLLEAADESGVDLSRANAMAQAAALAAEIAKL